jgi:UDP-3-O-[3-hydroxymyristoyl] glucosamine N-acyltransferase
MYTLAELARIIGADLIGNPEAPVHRVSSFELAIEGDVTMALDARRIEAVEDSASTAIIVASPLPTTHNLLIAPNPKLAFARAIRAFHEIPYCASGVSGDLIAGEGTVLGNDLSIYARVTLGKSVILGDRVTLHPGVVIGDRCSVGDDTTIHPNVSIYPDSVIGKRVVIHAGTVIGSDGFSFVPDENARQYKLLQVGRVVIEDDCEVGANCAIDRAGFGDTILHRGVKIDNLIQVGHNCDIGEDTVVAALTGFSGGTHTGKGCVIAGQVGTNQHVTIGDGATITARSGVTKSIPARAVIAGMAQDYNSWRRSQVLYSKLPELAERIKQLENQVRRLEDANKDR